MLRTKNGNHNSYDSPDSINQIDWTWKVSNQEVVRFYKNLINLRRQHPAFRMTSSEDLRNNLKFQKAEKGLISYQISNSANGDTWKNIYVVYNANPDPVTYKLKGKWQLAVLGDNFYDDKTTLATSSVVVPAISMMIAFQK